MNDNITELMQRFAGLTSGLVARLCALAGLTPPSSTTLSPIPVAKQQPTAGVSQYDNGYGSGSGASASSFDVNRCTMPIRRRP